MKKRVHKFMFSGQTESRLCKAAAVLIPQLMVFFLLQGAAVAQSNAPPSNKPDPDLTQQPTLYVVGYAHLDTKWRWEYPQVIREYLPKTMHDNFDLFAKYPHYIFNFSGANR